MKAKKLTKKICLALACGLVFTAGGQLNKAEAEDINYYLYGADVETEGRYKDCVKVENKGIDVTEKDMPFYRAITTGAKFNVFDNFNLSLWYRVYGGYLDNDSSDSEVSNNNITISGSASVTEFIAGGYVNCMTGDDIRIHDNRVTVSTSGKIGNVYGGYASEFASTSQNTIDNNTVTITGGTVGNVYGGYAKFGNASVSGNTVTISGGTVTGNVYGGLANYPIKGSATAENNNVTLGNKAGVGHADITGDVYINAIQGFSASADAKAGGTLNVYNVGNTIGNNLYAPGADINFYVPKDAVSGNTLLTVTKEAKITGAKIHAGVVTGSNLKKGDTINLLEATTLTCDETESMAADLTGTGLVKIDGTVKKVGNKSIVLTINEDVSQSLAEESKSLAETRAGGMAFLNSAADMAVGKGFMSAQAAAESDVQSNESGTRNNEVVRANAGFTPYAAIGGANMTYETGSYVDSKGWGINVGFSRIIKNENSKLTLAPFIEYGKASYDSYLENDVNTHGSGDNSFTGIGFMAKNEQKDGLYYEGSVRLGRSKGDYQGDASTYDSKYDTAANYLAFHAGIGKVQKLSEKSSLDYYGKIFYTHQNGDTVNVQSTLGDASYDFDAINSYRLRLGTRWSQKLGKSDKLYAGLAWDYEFDSEARAHYNGMSTPAPTMKGSSGMLELGWKQEATKDNPFGVDLGLTGWCGKQRGVSFNAGFSWAF